MRVPAELMAAVSGGLTVLTPSGELTTALTDAVEREYRRRGAEIWATPRIREFSSWLRELSAARQLRDPDSPRCLTEVEERELWRTVVADSELGREFVDPAAGARAARRARGIVSEYGIPFGVLEFEPSVETQAFLQWNAEFERRCRAFGCVSVDTLLPSAAPPPAGTMAWIESPAWRPMARQWLLRNGRPLQPQDAPALECDPGRLDMGSQRFVAATPDMELAAAAAWAARHLHSTEGFRAWVHIRDLDRRRAQVVDAFDAALMRQRFALREDRSVAAYAIAGGTALADYAPVRAALCLLRASSGSLSFQEFSELLRSPELHVSIQEASLAARLEIALRARAPSEADLATWLKLAQDTTQALKLSPIGAVQRVHQAFVLLRAVRGAQLFSAWVSVWVAAIEAGPWIMRSSWSSVEFQAAERFRELLGALAQADAVMGAHPRESAQRVLERAVRDTAFQPQTGVPAIWISAQASDPWLNYEGLWVTGCSDDRWPAPAAPVALLPVRLQREYHVREACADLQMQSAIDLQRRWQARAAISVFSWAADNDGIAGAPSPLLPAAPMLNESLPLPEAQPHWRALLRAAPRLEQFSDTTAPPFSGAELTRGVATLRDQSRCAFRGFAVTRLRTEQMQIPVPGFNQRERGDLVHHALEHVWSQLRDSKALASIAPTARHELLVEASRRAVETVCRRRDPGRRWRERELLRLPTLLGRWLDVEAQRAPFRVEEIEHPQETARFAGLDFHVRIDRVDSLADGARVLIDYKSGSATPDWRGERPSNPQLPIYALLRPAALIAVAYGRVNASQLEFVAESERRDVFRPGKKASKLEGQPSFASLIEVWRGRIERLAENFAAGQAEVAPTLTACATCDLQGLCRVPAALDAEDSGDE
jgi:probable DNA repair protein